LKPEFIRSKALVAESIAWYHRGRASGRAGGAARHKMRFARAFSKQ